MNKLFRISFVAFALSGASVLHSCTDEDPPLPDNTVKFQSATQGLGANDTEVTVSIQLDRAVETAGNLTVSFVPTGVTYGTDFTTDPAAVDGKISLPVAVGATSASFKVTKTNTSGLEGSESVVFTIDTVADGLVLGTAKTFTLSFSEIIATSAEMEVDGGGPTYPNRVFIDLSGNKQTAVARTGWDLAFSSKTDEFRVVLNSANGMLARKLDKNDLTDVTASDTVDFGSQVGLGAIFGLISTTEIVDFPDWIYETLSWMDDPKGDLTKTAIAEVSEEDDENMVYIINRGTGPDDNNLGWVKLRVLRDAGEYAVQYADINSGTFQTEVVNRDASTNLTYFSLTSGDVVAVEPAKGDWDIAWTGYTNVTPTGQEPTDPFVPYYFQDIILTNIGGAVETYTYTTGTTGALTYDTFTEVDLDDSAWVGDNQLSIGSSWRVGGGPGSAPSVNSTRFYLIKDANGNIYKLQFTALVDANLLRGKPAFKFELLTKGS